MLGFTSMGYYAVWAQGRLRVVRAGSSEADRADGTPDWEDQAPRVSPGDWAPWARLRGLFRPDLDRSPRP